jgi:hypothetical protein
VERIVFAEPPERGVRIREQLGRGEVIDLERGSHRICTAISYK